MTNKESEQKLAEEKNDTVPEKAPLYYEFPYGGKVRQVVERMIKISGWEDRKVYTRLNGDKITVDCHDDPYLVTKQFYQELFSASEYEEWEKSYGAIKNPK